MAVVQYIPAPPRPKEPRLPPQRPEPTDAETMYREARAENERMHVRERELRIAKAKQELIPRTLAHKQAAFLVLSIRARILAIPSEIAHELARESDEQRVEEKLASKLRSALDELVDFPERVSDPDWMLKLR